MTSATLATRAMPRTHARTRLLAAALGTVGVASTAAVFSQFGTLGLGLAPSAALILLSVPIFLAGRAAMARWLGGEQSVVRYPAALAAPSLAFYATFFLVPLVFLAVFAVSTNVGGGQVRYGFSLTNFTDAVDPLYVGAFVRTLRVAAVGTALVVACGLPLAYWLARYAPVRRRGLLLALVLVPFWTSFLIRAYSFLIIFSPSFFLSDWLQTLRLTDGPLDIIGTTTAVQLGLVYNYVPLFVLPAYAALERVNWTLVEAAGDLGATPARVFRQITLRIAAPGILAGALLVFIPMMGEYVIPLVLGGGRLDLVGNVVARTFLDAQDYPFGAAMALLVMAALSLFLALYLWSATRMEDAPDA